MTQTTVIINYLFGNHNDMYLNKKQTLITMKKQSPHKQIKAIDAEISRLQQTLPKLDLKEFETTCERINQLEIKRAQLLNPIENEQPLPTFKILIK